MSSSSNIAALIHLCDPLAVCNLKYNKFEMSRPNTSRGRQDVPTKPPVMEDSYNFDDSQEGQEAEEIKFDDYFKAADEDLIDSVDLEDS